MQVHGKNWSDNFRTQLDQCRIKRVSLKCPSPTLTYRADVSTDGIKTIKLHFNIADAPFKESYRDHTKNFKSKVWIMCQLYWTWKLWVIKFAKEKNCLKKISELIGKYRDTS